MSSLVTPDHVLQASEGKTRFVRLARLLMCGGTRVMRELFDFIIPPANLATVLSSPPVCTRLQQMKKGKLLTTPQWQVLFPPLGGHVQSISFDITLLFKLLRENVVSGLSPPSTGWDKLPNIADLSLCADMARIKYYRNAIAHGDEKMELNEQEFNDYWKEIKDALLRVVGFYAKSGPSVRNWETAIDKLLTDPLTENDKRNVEELKSWYLDERELKEMVDHIRLILESPENDRKVFNARFITKVTTFGAWLGGNIYILNRLKDQPELLVDYVKYGVIPTGIMVCSFAFGSIKLTLKAEKLEALDEFWRRYETGQLKDDFEKVLITQELRNLVNGQCISVSVEIDKEEFMGTRKLLVEEGSSQTLSSRKSFCVLPPKPSHEIIERVDKVTVALEQMKRLRNENKNEVTVLYLSGNLGCGKTEMARQIGQKFLTGGVTNETSKLTLVFTFNASSIDTLVESYTEFARMIGCPKDSIAMIIKAKDSSLNLIIVQLRNLVAQNLENYTSWLMIVDNVKDMKLVSRYFPQAGEKTIGNGQLLVTTQDSRSIQRNSHTYHLQLSAGMSRDEAFNTLAQISKFRKDEGIMFEVAKALDFQPLGLACAAIYMQHVRRREPYVTWWKFLQELESGRESGEQEVTEKTDDERTAPYLVAMKKTVTRALENEIEDDVKMHVFRFLSVMAPKPVSLQYVIQYTTKRSSKKDKEFVAASISTSSLLLKEIAVHKVVHECLQDVVWNYDEEKKFSLFLEVVETFSTLGLDDFQSNHFIFETGTLVVHFSALAKRLENCFKHLPSAQLVKHLYKRQHSSTNALLLLGDICLTHGSHDAARIYFETSLLIQERFESKDSPPMASTLNRLGKSLCGLQNFEKAKTCFLKALTIEEMAYGKHHSSLAVTLNNIGTSLRGLGLLEEATEYFRKSLDIQEMAYGTKHSTLITTLNNIGTTFRDLGSFEEAKNCFERALSVAESVENKDSNLGEADTLSNLGKTCGDLGMYEKAKTYFERALSIYEMIYNKFHPTVTTTMNNLGNILRDLGEYQEAKECFERVLPLDKQVYTESHPAFATVLNNLGSTFGSLGLYEKAKICFVRALIIFKNTDDKNNPSFASVLNNLGLILHDLGLNQQAKMYLERAARKMSNSKNETALSAILVNLGLVLRDLGQFKKANLCLKRALAINETSYDENHSNLAITMKNLALSFCDLGQYDDADAYFERTFSIEKRINTNVQLLASTLISFGDTFLHHKQRDKASMWFNRALAILRK